MEDCHQGDLIFFSTFLPTSEASAKYPYSLNTILLESQQNVLQRYTLVWDGPWSARLGPFLGCGSHSPTQPLLISNAVSVAVPNGSKRWLWKVAGVLSCIGPTWLTSWSSSAVGLNDNGDCSKLNMSLSSNCCISALFGLPFYFLICPQAEQSRCSPRLGRRWKSRGCGLTRSEFNFSH